MRYPVRKLEDLVNNWKIKGTTGRQSELLEGLSGAAGRPRELLENQVNYYWKKCQSEREK
jgi:hypothetical protein